MKVFELFEAKATGLASIDTAGKMASFLKANYHYTKSPRLTRRDSKNDREVVHFGEVPKVDWDKLEGELKALGAKLVKQSKGNSHLTTYKLKDMRFTATPGDDEDGNEVMLLNVASPNPKFDSSPYIGRPDE